MMVTRRVVVRVADTEVHVFGRGRAVLGTVINPPLISGASVASADGLIIRRRAGDEDQNYGNYAGTYGFTALIDGGRLRLQACDLVNDTGSCVLIKGGADPTLASCKCVTWAEGVRVAIWFAFFFCPAQASSRFCTPFV